MHMCMYIGICLSVKVFEGVRKKGVGAPRAGVTGNVSCLIQVLGTEPCPPQEQHVLIPFESSLSSSLC